MFQDGNARQAAEWYVSLLPDSRMGRIVEDETAGTTVEFTLGGRPFLAFDSPIRHEFDFTPSMSVFVRFTDVADVRSLFEQLATGGDVLMPLDDYGFSACFGWTTDRFGVSWQVGLNS